MCDERALLRCLMVGEHGLCMDGSRVKYSFDLRDSQK